MLYRKSAIFISLLFCSINAFCQSSFSFLNLPADARTSALGGINVSLNDGDLNHLVNNPALLDSVKPKQMAINYSPYLVGIQYVSLNYSWKNNWAAGFQNLHYGDFVGTDAIGNLTNNFSAADFALYVSHAHKQQNITFGISAKIIGSFIENYHSLAFASDWGGTFKHPKKNLTVALVAKNVGFVLQRYNRLNEPNLPFDLQLGMTFKPQYMPLRFSLTAHHLYAYNIVYFDPATDFKYDNNGNKVLLTPTISKKIFSHFIFGTEIFLHKNITALISYNQLRREELKIQKLGGLSGFSAGLHLKYKPFELGFSHAWFISSAGLTTFSFAYQFNKR